MSRVWITGIGAVSPGGLGRGALHPAHPAAALKVPEGLPLKEGLPSAAMRWLDASSVWFVNASRQALIEAGAEGLAETGVVTGLCWGSNPPVLALLDGLHREGFSAMNPGHFPYSVGNAPAAQAGILLGLRGPSVTLNAKEGSGIAALVEAGRMLDASACSRLLAGAVDHLPPFVEKVLDLYSAKGHPPLGEGAYALALERSEKRPPAALAILRAWHSETSPCEPHLYPKAGAVIEGVAGKLLAKAGWREGDIDLLALPGDTPTLSADSEAFLESRFPGARRLRFQESLGLCGASWTGAAALCALEISAGRAESALLIAVSTGGSLYGIALG